MNDPASTRNTSNPALGQVNRSTKPTPKPTTDTMTKPPRYSVYHWPSLYGTPKHFHSFFAAWRHSVWYEICSVGSITDVVPYGYYDNSKPEPKIRYDEP